MNTFILFYVKALNMSWLTGITRCHQSLVISRGALWAAQKNQLGDLCSTETLSLNVWHAVVCVSVCVCAKCVMSTLQNALKVLLCSLESCVSCSFHFNAGSGNLQHSPTGSSGQAAIERPQGITVLLQLSSQIIGLLWRGHCPHIQLIWDLCV